MFPSAPAVSSVVKKNLHGMAENVGFVAENGGLCRSEWPLYRPFPKPISFGAPAQMGYNESRPLCEGIIDLYSTEGY